MNFHVHKDVCSAQSCTQKLYSCRRALEQNYQQKRPFARLYTKYRLEPTLNVLCWPSLHLICCFLKQYHVSRSNIGFLCPSYMLRFETAPGMFLFWLWQGHFRTIGIISTILEPKENYT